MKTGGNSIKWLTVWSLIRRLDQPSCHEILFPTRSQDSRESLSSPGGLYRKILRVLIPADFSLNQTHWKIVLFVKMAKRKKDEDKFKSFRTMAEDLTEGFRSLTLLASALAVK